jgi:MoaA/NifB/PqqE/SkfB family radical SAM enzyme
MRPHQRCHPLQWKGGPDVRVPHRSPERASPGGGAGLAPAQLRVGADPRLHAALPALRIGRRTAAPRELDTAACLEVVGQLHDLGCELVTLSGGEPTLRDDWDLIARVTAARGIRVNLVTCGVYASPAAAGEIARRAAAAGLCNVGVSLDGTQATHEAIRGRGTFTAVLASIDEFVRAGVQVSVMTTLSRHNVDDLDAIRRIAMVSGAASWRLQLAKPMGKLGHRDDWMIPPRRLLDVIPWLARMKRDGPIGIGVGDSLGYYGPHDEVLRGRGWRGRAECWQGCQAGMQAIGIEADGGVKGCLSLQPRDPGADPFREASLAEASLDEIWHRPGIFAYNRDFTLDQLRGFCRRCAHAALCRGGARCVSASVTGDVREDPYCYHRLATQGEHGRGLQRSAAAAATALVLGLGGLGALGCGDRSMPGPGQGADAAIARDARGPEDATTSDARADGPLLLDGGRDASRPDLGPVDAAKPDGINCGAVCCMCDYGVIPPDVWQTCCAPCENVCCTCDYGVAPPPQCC